MDEEGRKEGDEGRDDVGAGMASGCEGASLGRRVYVLRGAVVGCSLGCSSWREGRLEIVGEETGATEVGVSELGTTKEEEARS